MTLDQFMFLEQCGYQWIRGVLDDTHISKWISKLSCLESDDSEGVLRSRGRVYGSRSLLQSIPELSQIVQHPLLHDFASEVLGGEFGIVRALYFDKPPDCTWSLPWHRDRTIAVREHVHCENGFVNPTLKAGVPHVVAPSWLLAKMLTYRIHVDRMHDRNGPLLVIPGSHDDKVTDGMLASNALNAAQTMHCQAGDVFAMRPLLAHCSIASQEGTLDHRRVIHLELAPKSLLPSPWQWNEFTACPN